MATEDVAAALERAEKVLRRRPDIGVSDDPPATVRWHGGTRVVATHANGKQVVTDMSNELGGTGDQVSPSWLMRAALAACTATRIAMAAAAARIELQTLELHASSRSDTRGLLSMTDGNGDPVPAGPFDLQLSVRISAPGVAPERLRALVEESQRVSPVACAIQDVTPVALSIDVIE
jgi:uncharacterized OsmC-like protein